MSKRRTPAPSADARPQSDALLPALLLLFVCSGACALIYEIVWFQLLEQVIGSSAVSLGVLLATYMGGMCLGSLLLPRIAAARRYHPLRVYAALELGIGAGGLLVLLLVPMTRGLYAVSTGHGALALVLRAIVCGICLLPPTVLMGATLPAASRWVEATPRGVSWIGFLYGGNTAGAVFGSLFAGFYLLRVYDMRTATVVALVLNAAVAGAALLLAGRTRERAAARAALAEPAGGGGSALAGPWSVYAAIALSGATALGAEVVWTRLLSLMLGATTYTFSMILGVFLTGLGLGSAAGAWLARGSARPRALLGWCQLLQTLGVLWAAVMIAKSLPFWPIDPSLAPSPWFNLQLDLTRCLWVVLPAACLWGASFPLALAAAATGRDADPGKLVSGVYAANTVGAIGGALLFSLVFVPTLGTRHSQQLIAAVCALSAVVVFASLLRGGETSVPAAASEAPEPPRRPAFAPVALVAALVLGVIATNAVPEVPGLLVAYGRYMVTWLDRVDVKYVGEGMNSSVAVSTLRSSGETQFHVAGKVEASTLPQDMRLQRMLAHIPALVHPGAKSVLVVGFGAGVTAGSFVPYPEMKRLVICEIEPLIPEVVSRYFTRPNNDVLRDPRTQVFYDDARSFILTTKEKFDVITSDPINPWVKGAASLYTREYFEAVKAHLNPGGIVTQWVPLYESTSEAVKSEVATFLEVFPGGTVWANNKDGGGYDLVLLGQVGPTKIDFEAMRQRFADPRYDRVAASLVEVGFESPVDLFSTYAGSAADLRPWLADAVINRDRNLRLQYLAAAGFNQYKSAQIYDEMVAHRHFPEGLFVADPASLARLRATIGGGSP